VQKLSNSGLQSLYTSDSPGYTSIDTEHSQAQCVANVPSTCMPGVAPGLILALRIFCRIGAARVWVGIDQVRTQVSVKG